MHKSANRRRTCIKPICILEQNLIGLHRASCYVHQFCGNLGFEQFTHRVHKRGKVIFPCETWGLSVAVAQGEASEDVHCTKRSLPAPDYFFFACGLPPSATGPHLIFRHHRNLAIRPNDFGHMPLQEFMARNKDFRVSGNQRGSVL